MHRQDGGRLGRRGLEGQRRADSGDADQPGQHGRERPERGVVSQYLPDREIEHGRR
jgi:hypothetical protein